MGNENYLSMCAGGTKKVNNGAVVLYVAQRKIREKIAGREKKNEMNKVILMGRLTRDPDIRTATAENTMTIARYTLAAGKEQEWTGEKQQNF